MYYVKTFTDSTDTGRTPSTNATSTAPTSSLSSTSLSQNTQQILSSWHRFKRRRDLLERRPTIPGIRHQAYGATPLATSRRDAALRYLSAFPYPAERPPPERALSSSCDCGRDEEGDASAVSLGWSLCYALLVLLTAVFALSTGVVLVRLIPAAAVAPPSGVDHGAALHDDVPHPSAVPSPRPKAPNRAATHTQMAGSQPTVPYVTDDVLPTSDARIVNSMVNDSLQRVNRRFFKDDPTPSTLVGAPTGGEDLEVL
ncbi:uncharacterized protein LOC144102413 [Amblyomma americanum]